MGSFWAQFESRSGHRLTYLRFLWFTSVPPGKYGSSASVRPAPLPSELFAVQDSPVILSSEAMNPTCETPHKEQVARYTASLFDTFKTVFGSHPASYLMGTRGSFPGLEAAGGEADHAPPSSAEIMNVWDIPPFPPAPSWRAAELSAATNLPLVLPCFFK
jgi:hypothetical protein